MSKVIEAEATNAESVISPGNLLKNARLSAGMQINDVAEKLFLKPHAIEELESDAIDPKRSLTFTKGYVRNYAKLLGLNVDDIIAHFEAYHNKPEPPAKLQSFSKRVAKQAHDDRWMMVTWVLLFLIIGGAVLWWYQQPESSVGETAIGQVAEAEPESETAQAMPEARSESVDKPAVTTSNDDDIDITPQQEHSLEKLEASQHEPVAEITPALTDPTESEIPVASMPDSETQEAQPNTEPEGAAVIETRSASDLQVAATLVFTFADDCWVNVEDGSGQRIAWGIKKQGRVMEISGQPPFQITLGAPHVVDITYNGESVDMSGLSKREIGRLTLPQ